jgi:hypothetical protein
MSSRGARIRLRDLHIVLAAAGGLALLGCDNGRDKAEQNAAAPPPKPEPGPAAAIPLPEPALDRERLLMAIARAASAFAAGADDRRAQRELAGRQFTFRTRFGCSGAQADPGGGSMEWSYDEARQTLKVRAKPDIARDSPLIEAMAGIEVEAVEGFWVARPWLLTASCPAAQEATPATAPAPSSVGLAQFFTTADSRVQRRSRAFETVQRLGPQSIPAAAGFNLVLAGRLKALPDGRVVRCAGTDRNARPTCVASVEFDRVSIENAETGAVVAEWGLA